MFQYYKILDENPVWLTQKTKGGGEVSNYEYSYCSKQKLTSCVKLIVPNFLPRFVQKMSKTKIKLLSVTFVNFRFILNVTTLIIQITGIFKTVMNPGIAQNVAAQFSLSIPYLATKTSQLAVLTLIVTSHSGKIQKMTMKVHCY